MIDKVSCFKYTQFPLLSKSSRLQTLVASTNDESNDEVDISDIPGGPAAFEICAKFCYGMIVTLNAYNVLAARCAAEYLEMFETIDKGNLIYKIDVFLSASIFRTWKDSIIVLQSTKSLQQWTENLKVINHCVDSIASKASMDPSEVDWSYTYNRKKLPSESGLDSHWNGVRKQQTVPRDWWVEDLCDLEVCLYKKVILAIKAKGRTSSDVIGEALRAYACRRLFSSLDNAVNNGLDCTKHCAALETIISLLPAEKGSVSCGLLLKLLRASCLLGSGETYRSDLIKRIGTQLDRASASDLLIPAESSDDAMYNVDVVTAMLEEFMLHHRDASGPKLQEDDDDTMDVADNLITSISGSSKLTAVAKLVDAYLSEIAKDPSLPLEKFITLAESVPPASRPVHDALYRAIDVYLKVCTEYSYALQFCTISFCISVISMQLVQNLRSMLSEWSANAGASRAVEEREEAGVRADGLQEAVGRRERARRAERAPPPARGGAGPLLRAAPAVVGRRRPVRRRALVPPAQGGRHLLRQLEVGDHDGDRGRAVGRRGGRADVHVRRRRQLPPVGEPGGRRQEEGEGRHGGAGAGKDEEGAGEAVVREGEQRGEQRVGRHVGEPRWLGQPGGDQVNAVTDHETLPVIVTR